MRNDMSKVLVERPRRGGGKGDSRQLRGNEKTRTREYDSAPKKEGMRKRALHARGYDAKELNENLGPLQRYLKAQVGRPWDKVYSEICDNMDRRSAVQLHIFEHIHHMVELTPTFINGYPHRSAYRMEPYPVRPGTLYVNEKGILSKARYNKKFHAKKKVESVKRFDIDDNSAYEKIQGIWYYVEFEHKDIPSPYWNFGMSLKDYSDNKSTLSSIKDVILNINATSYNFEHYVKQAHGESKRLGKHRVAVRKCQVSKAERKRQGLS